MGIRIEAVRDLFYPGDAGELTQMVDGFLAAAPNLSIRPKILISPHAGYLYSGACAAMGYKQLIGSGLRRVVLIGPSHRVGFEGAAFSGADFWRTPLGEVPLDRLAIASFLDQASTDFMIHPQPHENEHALEVQLPFLQRVLKGGFEIVPITYSHISPSKLTKLISYFAADVQTGVVISSDLSHFYPIEQAGLLDRACHRGVLALDTKALDPCEACGRIGIEAAIGYARQKGLKSQLLDYRTSADVTGDRSRVVGYASYGFY